MAACEKPILDENGGENAEMQKVTFRTFSISQVSFDDYDTRNSRSMTPIKDVCKRISLAIFKSDGTTKVKTITQESTDKNFGSMSVELANGNYIIIAIAHNGEGNATITAPSKITFKDNKVTDTFYYYGNIDVNNTSVFDISMKRAVAMFRLIVKDTTPQNIKSMKFYYTGGSSTFDATTGYGCVNSKQTELRTVNSTAYTGESAYDIYTFPHNDGKVLKIEISALEAANSTTPSYTRTFSDVAVTRNKITRYSGMFFDDGASSGRSFDLSTNDTWETEDYEY